MGSVKAVRRDAWTIVACAVAAIAYVPLASPYVQGGDVAELATLFAQGGVAHPPGYPLYTLILRAFAWVPAKSAAHGAALVTAAIQVGAVAMLARACRSWGASSAAAGIAAIAYAVSTSAWTLATHAEVFALNALIAAAIAYAAGPHARVTGTARVALLALLAGLGLAHHTTILAMAPVGIVGVLRGWRETSDRARACVGAALALCVGLSPYAYTLWRSHEASGWVWGDPMDFAALVRHVRRSEYWEIARTDPRGAAPFGAHLGALGEHLARDLLYVLVPFALVGVVARRAWAFVASFVLAGPAFLFMMSRGIGNVPFGVLGVSGRIVERFHLLPLFIACVPLAFGIDVVVERWRRARYAIAAAIAVGGALVARPRVVEDGRAIIETYLIDTLQTLPPNAVLRGTGDHRTFGFFYVQNVLGVRRDVTYVDAYLEQAAWYRRRVGTIDDDRPRFIANEFDRTTRTSHATYAIGTVIRVLPDDAALPNDDELEAMNEALVPRLHRASAPPADKWGWAADADDAYARPWLELAARAEAHGDAALAARAASRASAR